MGGVAGRIGSFLAGPWGALVLVGAMALSPLIEKLYQTMVSANKAEGALAGLIKRRAQELAGKNEIVDSEKGLQKLLNDRKKLEEAIAIKGRRDSKGRLMFVYAEQKALAKVNADIAAGRDAIDAARTTKLGLGLETVTRDLYKPEKTPKAKKDSAAEKAAKEAEKAKQRLAEIQIDIERIRNLDDQARAKSFTEMADDQQSKLQETIANIQDLSLIHI